MATYKVIQDIEAEDKLLGPLTLRQFIYAIIVVVLLYISFQLTVNLHFLVAVPLLPFIIFFGALAAPLGGAQSSEIWLLAKVRFFLLPRKRVWDQSGAKELVTITAPKQVERAPIKDFSQEEVHSRLRALANTIDTRGWAVKNVDVNMYAQPAYAWAQTGSASSDRLVDAGSFAVPSQMTDAAAVDDMFDENTSPRARSLDRLMMSSEERRRQDLLQNLQSPQEPAKQDRSAEPPADYWFLNQPDQAANPQPGYGMFDRSQIVQPGRRGYSQPNPVKSTEPNAEEQALLERLHHKRQQSNQAYSRLKTIQPLSDQPSSTARPAPADDSAAQSTSGKVVDPAIIDLANNDDLSVATIARQADKARRKEPPADEVVVPLH